MFLQDLSFPRISDIRDNSSATYSPALHFGTVTKRNKVSTLRSAWLSLFAHGILAECVPEFKCPINDAGKVRPGTQGTGKALKKLLQRKGCDIVHRSGEGVSQAGTS